MWLFIEGVGEAETSLVCCVWALGLAAAGAFLGEVLLPAPEAERDIQGQN